MLANLAKIREVLTRARCLKYTKATVIVTVVAGRRVVLIDFDHADPDFTYSNDEAWKQFKEQTL